jgi:VIT1/CCC1 family predicted Fe2+/Mn2+ transporter
VHRPSCAAAHPKGRRISGKERRTGTKRACAHPHPPAAPNPRAGLDGIITTFAVVASVVGASMPIEVIVLTGFAKLIGDALSMGVGDMLSEGAEQKFILGERKREEWEYANYPEGERKEMVDIYVGKGFSRPDAQRLIDIMTSKPAYKDFFVDHMMVQELGQVVPDPNPWNPAKNGLIAFCSFVVWGSIPLWAYVGFLVSHYENKWGQFGVCIALTILCLFGLGAMQGRILHQPMLKLGIGMTVNGGAAAVAAYLVSWGLHAAVGDGGSC